MPLDQLDPSLFAKARAGKGRDNVQKQKEIGALEAQIYHLTEILGVSYCLFRLFSIFSHSAHWDYSFVTSIVLDTDLSYLVRGSKVAKRKPETIVLMLLPIAGIIIEEPKLLLSLNLYCICFCQP